MEKSGGSFNTASPRCKSSPSRSACIGACEPAGALALPGLLSPSAERQSSPEALLSPAFSFCSCCFPFIDGDHLGVRRRLNLRLNRDRLAPLDYDLAVALAASSFHRRCFNVCAAYARKAVNRCEFHSSSFCPAGRKSSTSAGSHRPHTNSAEIYFPGFGK